MPAEPLQAAARIFRAEARDGYRDRVVIGGLSGFVATLEHSVDSASDTSDVVGQAAALLRDYAALDTAERRARLAQAQRLLIGDPAGRPSVSDTPRPVSARSEAGVVDPRPVSARGEMGGRPHQP